MSVLFCRVPEFLIAPVLRAQPTLAHFPLGLVGEDERIDAASPLARESGVHVGMRARQARMRCPDLLLRPLDSRAGEAEQQAFLAQMARWELPIEEHGWGAAWVDLHSVTTRAADVRPLAAELGRRVRSAMGDDRQPALGWDSSKFTSRAAATIAAAGTMRMVGKAEESHFLSPLPVALLPLPEEAQQQLRWLGIRTLGQYAALPPTAVWQRYGQVGKLAQRWAQGKDNRPVANTTHTLPTPITLDFDPPSDQIGRVLADLMLALAAPLQELAVQLAGVRRLRLTLHFLAATPRVLDVTFIEPASQPARVQAALAQHLQTLVWPGDLERLDVDFVDVGELVAGQLSLFGATLEGEGGADEVESLPLAELAHRWTGRYGRVFFYGQIHDALHPVHERVYRLQAV